MVGWKERGYVPDSDDEDEILVDEIGQINSHESQIDIQIGDSAIPPQPRLNSSALSNHEVDSHSTTVPPLASDLSDQGDDFLDFEDFADDNTPFQDPPCTDQPSSTAARLEAELSRGIQLTQDVLGPLNDLDDATDSPLSSPPASLPDSLHHAEAHMVTASLLPTVNNENDLDALAGVQDSFSVTPLSRSLRRRAPIQLHPYALEDAKYRQSLRDRGLKPVRTLGTVQAPEDSAQDDSQDHGTYESSQVEEPYQQIPSSSLMMQDADDESQSPVRPTRMRIPAFDLGEDLPELDDILQTHAIQPLGAAAIARKRLQRARKVSGILDRDEYRIYDLPDDENEAESVDTTSQARFRIHPSPPRSRDGISSQDGITVEIDRHFPNDRTPLSLPTPMLSSEARPQKRRRSASASSRISISLEDSDDSSDSTMSERSNVEPGRFQRMQRRIKGVLPASWLKLDQKKQLNVEVQKHKLLHSPVKSVAEKGVAKRIPASTARNVYASGTQPAFDDRNVYGSSESDTDEPAGLQNNDTVDDGFVSLMEDVIEDNAIDAMLPARARARAVSRRKKQQKLGDMWENTHDRPRKIRGRSGTRNGRSYATNISSKVSGGLRPRKKMKKVHAQPRITVLDAPGFEEQEIPRFLRIAARRRKKPEQQQEQDPSTKFFRLATKRDTMDVMAGLAQWRSRRAQTHATLTPRGELPRRPPATRPMKCISVTAKAENNNTHLTFLKQSTESTLKRVQLNQTQGNLLVHQAFSQPQRASHLLAGLFKPSSASFRRSGVGQSLDIFKRSLTQSEPRVNPSNHTLLPRRVPKNSSNIRNNPGQNPELKALLPSGVAPSQQHRARRPRKYRPMALATRENLLDDPNECDDTMHAADEIKISSSNIAYLESFPKNGIVTHLMDHPLACQPLDKESCLKSSRLWQKGILQRTIESMADLRRLLEPTDSSISAQRPISGQAIYLGQWSPDVQDFMSELSSAIISITSFDPTSIDLTTNDPITVQTRPLPIHGWQDDNTSTQVTCNTAQQWDQLMTRCQRSLEDLIGCINRNLWFFSSTEINDFVKFGISMVEQVVHEFNLRKHARVGPTASRMLDLLNRVIILSYQITKVAEYNGHYGLLVEQSVGAYQTVTHLAWSIALREDYAGDLFSYLASFTEASSSARTSVAAELETVLVVRQLCRGNFWDIYLKQFLVRRFVEPDAHPAETLSYTILILACVYYLFGADHEDYRLDRELPESPESSGLIALQTALPAFLTFFLDTKQSYQNETRRTKAGNMLHMDQMDNLSRFSMFTFEWCFLLASNFSKNNTDQLLKKIFKCYGDNKMHDFFSPVSSHVMPDFLARQIPHSQLVLDYNDNDFHIFLKLVASSLGIRSQAYEVEYSARLKKLASRKQSLVFSLLPNNAFQVNDDENLTLRDLAAVANRYNLFSTLYHYSPAGYKPPLANIETLIDFGKSHEAVCNLALQCWASIGKSALAQEESTTHLIGLGRWIQDMFTQVADKLSSIPNDDDGSDQEQRVNNANRQTASGLLCTIAQIWSNVIELCTTETQARHILNGDRHQGILAILHVCFDHTGPPDSVIVKVLNVICSYLKKASEEDNVHALEQDLQRILQKLIIRQNNRRWSPNDDLLVALMDTWYQLAKSMVRHKVSSWESYINPASKLSLDVMLDFPISGHCITLFLSKALMHKACFDADPALYFEIWITSILLPQKYFKFQHLLTSRLVESAPETLDLADVIGRLDRRMSPGAPFDCNTLLQYRLEIVLHIVRSIHKLHNTSDCSNVGALSSSQALQLLYSIQKSMKWSWNNDVEMRDDWAVFINEVVFEMNLYRVEALEIDESLTAPEIRRHEVKAAQLRRLFIKAFAPGHVKTDAVEVFKSCVQGFRETCEVACFTNEFYPLLTHTAATFNASEEEYIDDNGIYLLDIKAQMQFLKAVLPEYIARAFDETTPAMLYASTILEIAILVVAPMEYRIDFEDMAAMESFAELTVMLLRASYLCLKGRAIPYADRIDWKKLIILRVIELVALAATAWGTLQLKYPESEPIAALQVQVQTYVCFVYEYAGVVLDQPWEPIDPGFTYNLFNYSRRDQMDFGFVMPATEPGMTEELGCLRALVEGDLAVAARSLVKRSELDQFRGPAWGYESAGAASGEVFAGTFANERDERELVHAGLSHLLAAMALLGVREEEAWGG